MRGFAGIIPVAAKWTAIGFAAVCLYGVCRLVYNVFFHPLRAFPGPLANRITVLPKLSHLVSGRLPYYVTSLHEQYGSVVRIAPNELAFTDPRAWKDIYSRKGGGSYEMPHDLEFYNATGSHTTSIISSTREEHDPVRKLLSPGFSDRAMRAQEPIISGYVDLLVDRLRDKCIEGPNPSQSVNMRDWIAYTTFDIIGHLAFGSHFGCLETSAYHPWINLMIGSLKNATFLHTVKALGILPLMGYVMKTFGVGDSARQMHSELTLTKTKQRVEMGTGRDDFLDGLIKAGLSIDNLQANGGLLIIAGSETTATLLTGALFFLTTHRDVLEKLTVEIRGRFKTKDEMKLTTVNDLTYMMAFLNEAMRSYPPVAIAAPRVVPEAGATIGDRFVPGGTVVGVWHWAMYHDAALFTEPYQFNPDRYLRIEEGGHEKFSNDRLDVVNPFLLGPRNCLGQNLAYAEMRLIIARLIWEFDMSICDDSRGWLKDQSNYFLWDKPALNIRLHPAKS